MRKFSKSAHEGQQSRDDDCESDSNGIGCFGETLKSSGLVERIKARRRPLKSLSKFQPNGNGHQKPEDIFPSAFYDGEAAEPSKVPSEPEKLDWDDTEAWGYLQKHGGEKGSPGVSLPEAIRRQPELTPYDMWVLSWLWWVRLFNTRTYLGIDKYGQQYVLISLARLEIELGLSRCCLRHCLDHLEELGYLSRPVNGQPQAILLACFAGKNVSEMEEAIRSKCLWIPMVLFDLCERNPARAMVLARAFRLAENNDKIYLGALNLERQLHLPEEQAKQIVRWLCGQRRALPTELQEIGRTGTGKHVEIELARKIVCARSSGFLRKLDERQSMGGKRRYYQPDADAIYSALQARSDQFQTWMKKRARMAPDLPVSNFAREWEGAYKLFKYLLKNGDIASLDVVIQPTMPQVLACKENFYPVEFRRH